MNAYMYKPGRKKILKQQSQCHDAGGEEVCHLSMWSSEHLSFVKLPGDEFSLREVVQRGNICQKLSPRIFPERNYIARNSLCETLFGGQVSDEELFTKNCPAKNCTPENRTSHNAHFLHLLLVLVSLLEPLKHVVLLIKIT